LLLPKSDIKEAIDETESPQQLLFGDCDDHEQQALFNHQRQEDVGTIACENSSHSDN